jgi:hypothetical protein
LKSLEKACKWDSADALGEHDLWVQALIASTLNLLLQSWCVQKGGPFIVSLYVPLQMLMVAVLSVLLLKDTLYMGMYALANSIFCVT